MLFNKGSLTLPDYLLFDIEYAGTHEKAPY